MSNFKRQLLQSISFGIESCNSKTDERKLIQTNIAVYIAMFTIVVFNIGFVISGNVALIYSGLVQLPFWLLMPITLVLNKRGRRLEASLWIFAMVMLDSLTALLVAQGISIGIHYYFLMFSILPASFIDTKHWPTILILFSVNLGLFGYFEIFGWQPHPSMLEIPEATLHLTRITMVTSCVATVLLLIISSEYYSRENEQKLQLLANTDALTGLPNRRAFMEQLQRVIQDKRSFNLLLIDIDHFKRINDSYGHLVGDQALSFLAKEMNNHIRDNDFIGRIGGEEFAIVMQNTSSDCVVRAQNMCNHIAKTRFNLGQLNLVITISIGLCQVQPPARFVNIITLADAALYEAKNNGRNRVEVIQSQG